MKIYASSGDEGGGGITVPDQPSSDSGGMDTAALIQQQMQSVQPQRDAIAQAIMMQQAQQAQYAQAAQQVNPWAQMFGAHSAPSGSPTDVGWMNALQPGQGGVTVGGQPGTEPSGGAAFTGGGSMRTPNANYWMGASGRGLTPKVPGYDDSWLYGGGPGNNAGDPGTSNQGATDYGRFSFTSDNPVFGPEDSKGVPKGYTPVGQPQGPQGMEDYSAKSLPGLIGLYGTDYSTPNRGVVGEPFSPFGQPTYGNLGEQAAANAAAVAAAAQAAANAAQDAEQDAEDDDNEGLGASAAGPY
jgi:hypothetical protein